MKSIRIATPENRTFKSFLKLSTNRGIRKNRMALLSGPKPISEVLEEFAPHCLGVITSENQALPAKAVEKGLTHYSVVQPLFRRLDVHGTGRPLLLVRTDPFRLWDPSRQAAGCTLLIPFQDPANVGAVIRSAAAFGAARAVLLKEAANPFLPKSTRAAGSCLFRIELLEGPSVHDLGPAASPVITLSPQGRDVRDFVFPSSFLLLPGIEGPGLPSGLEHSASVSIPMERGVESLNAALAAGIALYLCRHRY